MKIRNAGGCLWIAPAMLWAGAALSNTDADPEGNTYRYEVPGFWNSTVATMESQLHITNPTAAVGNMEIRGYYKNAVQADGVFSGRIGPKWSVDLGAREIEEGGGGISEDGIGPAFADFPRWFLVVKSDQRLVVRHLVRQEGVWRNFSTAAVNVAQAPAPADPPTEPEPPAPPEPPTPEPPTPPPASGPIGVIAAGWKEASGKGYAWTTVLNVANRASAIAQARLACRNSGLHGCEVVGDWSNACGSLAVRYTSYGRDFWFGSGPTEQEAESDALSVCTGLSGDCSIAYDDATGYNATFCTGTAAQ